MSSSVYARYRELSGIDFSESTYLGVYGVVGFLMDAGFEEKTLFGWCQKDSTVDLVFVVDTIQKISAEAETLRLFKVVELHNILRNRITSIAKTDIDSARHVELVVLSMILTARNPFIDLDWHEFASAADSYVYDDIIGFMDSGLSLNAIIVCGAKGVDSDLVLSIGAAR